MVQAHGERASIERDLRERVEIEREREREVLESSWHEEEERRRLWVITYQTFGQRKVCLANPKCSSGKGCLKY